ncbi:hypothetical protein A8C32_05300 [Flavivirga aquatica]|uniref:Uncharacterized protein n=1 Tax=Flavivirga aquatica TaxID=1849968 RepID=A0A1E5SHL1_9FLAO|nr:hypothetical protein [Flavivirga aquatica]OEJ98617.1 hypothetical protein A8C32_05300 [Flavivirga aquatica]
MSKSSNFFGQPIFSQLINLLPKDNIDLIFISKNGDLIEVNKIEKPVYIQTFSRRNGQCNRELESLNILAEKYKGTVEFILLINKDHESNPMCQS